MFLAFASYGNHHEVRVAAIRGLISFELHTPIAPGSKTTIFDFLLEMIKNEPASSSFMKAKIAELLTEVKSDDCEWDLDPIQRTLGHTNLQESEEEYLKNYRFLAFNQVSKPNEAPFKFKETIYALINSPASSDGRLKMELLKLYHFVGGDLRPEKVLKPLPPLPSTPLITTAAKERQETKKRKHQTTPEENTKRARIKVSHNAGISIDMVDSSGSNLVEIKTLDDGNDQKKLVLGIKLPSKVKQENSTPTIRETRSIKAEKDGPLPPLSIRLSSSTGKVINTRDKSPRRESFRSSRADREERYDDMLLDDEDDERDFSPRPIRRSLRERPPKDLIIPQNQSPPDREFYNNHQPSTRESRDRSPAPVRSEVTTPFMFPNLRKFELYLPEELTPPTPPSSVSPGVQIHGNRIKFAMLNSSGGTTASAASTPKSPREEPPTPSPAVQVQGTRMKFSLGATTAGADHHTKKELSPTVSPREKERDRERDKVRQERPAEREKKHKKPRHTEPTVSPVVVQDEWMFPKLKKFELYLPDPSASPAVQVQGNKIKFVLNKPQAPK